MKCERCNKPITKAHIVDHVHYCSDECAIAALTDDIIMNAKECAKEFYSESVEIVDMDVTRCTRCGKPLALNKTAWSSIDGMYCSHECGVNDAYYKYGANEYKSEDEHIHKATRYFEDVAEEITREDYGAKAELYIEYAKDLNKTFIFEKVSENDIEISTELVGYCEGELSVYAEEYIGKLKYTRADWKENSNE